MQSFIQFHHWLVGLSRRSKRWLLAVGDILAIAAIFWLAYAIRVGSITPELLSPWMVPLAGVVTVLILYALGYYRGIVRYSGRDMLRAALLAITVSVLVLTGCVALFGEPRLPRSVLAIFWALGLIYLFGNRVLLRNYLNWVLHGQEEQEPVAIYGAGRTGIELATALEGSRQFVPVAFVDDNPALHEARMLGIPVLSPSRLARWAEAGRVRTVLMAMPSASRQQRAAVISRLERLPVSVKSVPSMAELMDGRARIEQVQDVAIEDLLGRDPVPPREDLLAICITGRNVLVTGAGGSIGSELCRQILQRHPRRLVLVEHSEFALYAMEKELRAMAEGREVEIVPVLGSVLAQRLLLRLCRQYRIHTFYHAAAYKHVPIVEHNPAAGVRNNILGTYEAARAAQDAGVERFILISTDKAVRPTNVMGATKRFAELILQGLAAAGGNTVFTMVRFGNVLGSSGSVVPLFREQINQGGPVTVTHQDVTRYFMTIPEASQLVMQAGAMARGGEVFVLDMGEPVRIYDLAVTMIHLMGRRVRSEACPDGDIEIHISGLRPGEKLYEELLFNDDGVSTEHPMIMQAREERLSWEEVELALDLFREALANQDEDTMRKLLRRYVVGYQPTEPVRDPQPAVPPEPASQAVALH